MWVRTASKRDCETISELLANVWHHTYDGIYGAEKVSQITGAWHNVRTLQQKITQPASEFLVADNGTKICGMAFALQINDTRVKLSQLYVLPDMQGRGVGKILLDEILESFFEAQEFVLEVEEKNTSAIRFYEKFGFVKTGKTENCGDKTSQIPALIYTLRRN